MSTFPGTDRFQVQGHLGSGAFGDVYRVYDRKLGTVVALKTLQRADAASLNRFKREFRALAELTHPNLVHLYELLAADERWFFTMELVDGDDFLTFIRQPPSVGPEDETLALAAAAGQLDRLRDAMRQLAKGLRALRLLGRQHLEHASVSVGQTFQTRIGETRRRHGRSLQTYPKT